jgi:hypothetical protein
MRRLILALCDSVQRNLDLLTAVPLAIALGGLTLAACGGGDSGTAVPPPPQTNTLVALTPTYSVEYDPGATTAMEGKTPFTIRVTNRATGSGVPGASIGFLPVMHMTGMTHTTPVDNDVVENGGGAYTATAYFLMPTMGSEYWELTIRVNGDNAVFTPTVGMAMAGNTVRANLKGQNDNVAGMMMGMEEHRTYYLFRDKLAGTAGNRTFGVFLAAQESMMDMPALVVGGTLHDPMGMPWTVNNLAVSASTDNGATWVPGTNAGGARWEFPNLGGLPSGAAGHIWVRLLVNGEQKTTDGNAPSGANGYADFTVTPM